MKRITLQFDTLSELTKFAKGIKGGYLLNTNNLTITTRLPELQVAVAQELFNAVLLETKANCYELH